MKRIKRELLTIVGIATLFLALAACTGNSSVSTGVGVHRSPSGNWGHSISFGVHSHGRGW